MHLFPPRSVTNDFARSTLLKKQYTKAQQLSTDCRNPIIHSSLINCQQTKYKIPIVNTYTPSVFHPSIMMNPPPPTLTIDANAIINECEMIEMSPSTTTTTTTMMTTSTSTSNDEMVAVSF
jgi:hypothetical protein